MVRCGPTAPTRTSPAQAFRLPFTLTTPPLPQG
jgi:hypothetical protein